MREVKCKNAYTIDIKDLSGNIAAHMDCNHTGDLVQIHSLFVSLRHCKECLRALLLEKAEEYAKSKNAKKIIVFPGAEPFCKDGQIPLEQEISFYVNHGYVIDHYVMGTTPCMAKQLPQEVCL